MDGILKKKDSLYFFVSFRHKGIQKTILSRSCNNRKGEKEEKQRDFMPFSGDWTNSSEQRRSKGIKGLGG